MRETWKECSLSDRYLVSNLGNVKYKDGRVPKTHLRRDGYVAISIDRKPVLLHRVVGLTWKKQKPNKPHINHKNGIKTDNRASNLEWCDAFENQYHRFYVLGKMKTNTTNHYRGLDNLRSIPLKFVTGGRVLYFENANRAKDSFGVKYGTSISNAISRGGKYKGGIISQITREEYKQNAG